MWVPSLVGMASPGDRCLILLLVAGGVFHTNPVSYVAEQGVCRGALDAHMLCNVLGANSDLHAVRLPWVDLGAVLRVGTVSFCGAAPASDGVLAQL